MGRKGARAGNPTNTFLPSKLDLNGCPVYKQIREVRFFWRRPEQFSQAAPCPYESSDMGGPGKVRNLFFGQTLDSYFFVPTS